MYESLNQATLAWANTEITIFDQDWFETHGQYPSSNSFKSSGFKDFDEFLAEEHILGREYLMASIVSREIHKHLFGNDQVFFGLEDSQASFLNTAEKGLCQLDPPRSES